MKKLLLTTLTFCSLNAIAGDAVSPYLQERFAQLDADSSGYLNSDEFRGTTRDWMTKANLSESEQVKRSNKKLKKLDKNNDKKISLEEFAAAHKKGKK
ncbi:hypothetical protein E2K93_07495 [Thalassotalea sp. HSM 43]|uniref:EF-hand domain-containing protein n=1 Tax=Thalassotalea sp. HSM 43 TaxID=2552945 RepID=UPI0010819D8A|nr:EF-hand domain-containing protein [Thalassotalea sp. HSM 43]QBY04241.1 hypothetical protein E2K93_07495 [Thalassotalea sp. HSM 43]